MYSRYRAQPVFLIRTASELFTEQSVLRDDISIRHKICLKCKQRITALSSIIAIVVRIKMIDGVRKYVPITNAKDSESATVPT